MLLVPTPALPAAHSGPSICSHLHIVSFSRTMIARKGWKISQFHALDYYPHYHNSRPSHLFCLQLTTQTTKAQQHCQRLTVATNSCLSTPVSNGPAESGQEKKEGKKETRCQENIRHGDYRLAVRHVGNNRAVRYHPLRFLLPHHPSDACPPSSASYLK